MERRLQIRTQGLCQVVAHHLGIDLDRQSAAAIAQLLDKLPEPIDPADRVALRTIEQACAIGETCFLRHPDHLAALQALLPTLPGWRQREPLRVWSAGCSSGEEAYSLAAVLMPAWPGRIQILGTDVREAAIGQAVAGRYRGWSLRGTTQGAVAGWLLARGDDMIEVHPSLREIVEFRVHNLMHDPYPQGLDVLFCRNVLMYFHEAAASSVLSRFARCLRPGGLLFLGDVDPAPEQEPLRPQDAAGRQWSEERLGMVRLFRRTAQPLQQSVAEPPRAEPAAAQPAPAPARLESAPSAQKLERALARARRLCDLGEIEAGLSFLRELVTQFPLEVAPQILLCMLARDASRAELAREAARCACFLCPEQPICQFLMGACLLEAGERPQARIHLSAAARLLSALPDLSRPIPLGEGLTGRHLQRMIHAYSCS